MEAPNTLVGSLLIAMPALADPNFRRSVVLIGAHSIDDGAFGLVINRPIEVQLEDILSELGVTVPDRELPRVLAGGPVQPSHGFVLFETSEHVPADDDLVLGDGLVVSGSTDTLADFAGGRQEGRFSLILGYSGWYPGQLETEIEENSWLIAPVTSSIVFETPYEDRWVAALDSIGVNPGTLVDSGTAMPT
jgi:putative transcriptional regulator